MASSTDREPPASRQASLPAWVLTELAQGRTLEERECPFCGEAVPFGSAFCPRDGRALTVALLPARDRPFTVVFTDIEDSVRLNEWLGDAHWEGIVDVHNAVIREAIERHAGFEVKVMGDGFLIAFTDPVHAVQSAIVIQRRIEEEASQRHEWAVRVRIGIHAGDVILRPGGDIFGRTVNVAARILSKSRGGEIWTSEAVYRAVSAELPEVQWRDRGMRRLKGVAERQRLYELVWSESA